MSLLMRRLETSLLRRRRLLRCLPAPIATTTTTTTTAARFLSDGGDGPKKRISKVKKKKSSNKESTGRSRDLELLLAFLDAPKAKPPPPEDDEEAERRERIRASYAAGTFRKHNEENHEIACKLRMKKHALNMLPKGTVLREKALSDDNDEDLDLDLGEDVDRVRVGYPPRWRTIPAWTPPVPGFDPSEHLVTEE